MFPPLESSPMTTVLLVRHGETTWNRDERVQGWAPTPLTDRGREQARAVAGALASSYTVDRLVTSDLRRARRTAATLSDHLDCDPSLSSAWRERDFGRLQGLPRAAVFEDDDDWPTGGARDAADVRPESGESVRDVAARVRSGWETLLARSGRDETVVVVCHGGPINLTVGAAKGLDPLTAVTAGTQRNCELNELRVVDGETTVVAENRTAHLDSSASTAD